VIGPPQIFLDVVGQGAERRNVDTAHARFQSIRFKFAEKRIKNTKKPGQRFPASGWRGQQNRFTVKNGGNADQLGVSEPRKTREKTNLASADAVLRQELAPFSQAKIPSSRSEVEGSRCESLKINFKGSLVESMEHRPMACAPRGHSVRCF